ncbi:MAG TPA: vanadium-dependent haloperoxidase [Acidimicrobiia bacterium]|nr:vanadium-dependent haloperoxidase [Acidimicrobiia bacterium]
MKKRVIAGLTVLALLLPAGVSARASTGVSAAASADLNPVVRWDRILLNTIRVTKTPASIAARALAVLHTCMYDAWAAYDPVAEGTRLRGTLRRPAGERTLAAKREAVSRAARLAAADLYPERAALFDADLAEEGYDPSEQPAEGSPAAVAERACLAVVAHRHRDGANQLGDEPGSAGGRYSDWTGYRPVNDPDRVRDPDRWQPLRTPDGRGGEVAQQFTTPHWGRVLPFAAGESDVLAVDPGPPRAGTAARQAEVEEMVELSAGLTDEDKVIAEYWIDGPGMESPPGHWMIFGQLCSRRFAHGLDADVKLFFVLANAMLDASIATWAVKRRFDSIRPISLVRHAYAGRAMRAWGGPHQGTQQIEGSMWKPYLPTPPFPEYTSGHSSFSAAGAEALRLFTGRDDFGASVVIPAGSSEIEPGTTPTKDVVLHWKTFSEAANQAGLSRRLGGIHFMSGDLGGRVIGRRVAARVLARAQAYFAGVASQTPG